MDHSFPVQSAITGLPVATTRPIGLRQYAPIAPCAIPMPTIRFAGEWTRVNRRLQRVLRFGAMDKRCIDWPAQGNALGEEDKRPPPDDGERACPALSALDCPV